MKQEFLLRFLHFGHEVCITRLMEHGPPGGTRMQRIHTDKYCQVLLATADW